MKQMNVFSPHTVTVEDTKRHCGIKLLTATGLWLRISCRWLMYIILLAATCLSFILFSINSFVPNLLMALKL